MCTKRILALLMAVVLIISALPFSISADEIELAETDAPALFAQDPFAQVKSEVEGGTNAMTSVGVTRQAIIQELEAHEHDSFYLGTKYAGDDAQSPNGDASYNSGTVGMNCGGFVSYVLRKAGLDAETTMEIMHRTPVNQYGSGLPYDWLAGASNYKNLVENGQISAYAFRTKQELLSSGLAEKGDIILMWWNDTPGADGADNHIGFFWGEASDDDVMWHSGTEPSSGNQISAITPKTPGSFYILIKIEPVKPKGHQVTLTKTSADVSITQGNSAYSLAGASYNVYKGTSGSGSAVATFTTDESGHATLSTPLEDGTYSVKESKPPKGYKLDEKVYTFTIDGSDTSLSVEDEPGTMTLRLKKKDSQTGSTPQGNASLAGAVYQVSYQKSGQTVTEELISDKSGNLDTLEGIPFGTVTVKELTAPEGYRLDTQVHTYTVDGSQLTGDVYELEVTDLAEEVQRGGLTIQKLDSQTGTTPQGDASLDGITFEIINNSKNPVMVEGQKYQPGEVVKTLVTDSQGKASTASDLLPYGEYILRESATNESMLLTAPDQIVNVTDDGVIYEFTMTDEVVRGGVLIEKRDLESGLLTPLGGASLDGTLFEITNKSVNAVYVGGVLYQPGEVCATIEVVDGIAQTDARALPYGSYQMVESKPGKGYLHTDQLVRSFQIRRDGQVVEYRDEEAAYNQVIRGDLQFVKVGEDTMHRFANVAFQLTSQTTGESHIVVTDENGEVRTTTEWNPHSQNTNGNDGVEEENAWDDHNGSWFGLTTEGWLVDVQDELCALPFDTYLLEELPCEGNQGYELVKIPNITISRNNTTIHLGTIDDQFAGVPEISTTATVNGEHTAEPAGEVTIVDAVTYKNLKVGQIYKLSGILMDKETGEPLLVGNQQITAETEFTPTKSEGIVELAYSFDASTLAGKAVVVFEDLYQDGNIVASHADIGDEGQTVTFHRPAPPNEPDSPPEKPLVGKITGHKTGAEAAPLEGVIFGLFDKETTEFTEETALAISTTNKSGEFSFEAPYGDYQVKELKAAPGYVTKKEPVAVKVNAAEVELDTIVNHQTVIHISKVDAETGEELPGATLELYAPNGVLLETWETSEIPHVVTGLPVGEGYLLKELSAPAGFQLAEDITFAVEESSEIQFVGMVDERSPKKPEKPEKPSSPDEPTKPDKPTPTVPQTGGSRAVLWVGALLILALGGLGITLILLKKQNKL